MKHIGKTQEGLLEDLYYLVRVGGSVVPLVKHGLPKQDHLLSGELFEHGGLALAKPKTNN